jgi:hypothetical protein
VEERGCWSSTTLVTDPTSAWGVSLGFGLVGDSFKTTDLYVWPVRDG